MKFVVSIEKDPRGIPMRLAGEPFDTKVAYFVRQLGAGKPIPTAGGQRDSKRAAGPFASYEEARRERDRREPDLST